MKKAFYISIILISTLFVFIAIGFSNPTKTIIEDRSSREQMYKKTSELHVVECAVSLSENVSDEEGKFFHLENFPSNLSVINKGNAVIPFLQKPLILGFPYHYCLAKYLLFHNLKIIHSRRILSIFFSIKSFK